MNLINTNNYEAFLLDYSEGTLPAEQVAELLLFVELHPELEIDLNEFELVYLDSNASKEFENKELLKQLPRIEELVIGHTESVLTDKEINELNALSDEFAAVEKLKTAYQKTILPSQPVIYPHKKDLKRTQVVPIYWLGAAVAAMLIGFVVLFDFSPSAKQSYATTGDSWQIEKINNIESNEVIELALSMVDTIDVVDEQEKTTPVPLFKEDVAVFEQDKPVGFVKKDSVIHTEPAVMEEVMLHVPEDIVKADQDTVVSPIEIPEDDNLAMVPNEKIEPLSVKDFLKLKTKEIVLKDKGSNVATADNNDLLASLAASMNEKTKMDVAYHNEVSDDKKITKFKLGKIEFYKSSSK